MEKLGHSVEITLFRPEGKSERFSLDAWYAANGRSDNEMWALLLESAVISLRQPHNQFATMDE